MFTINLEDVREAPYKASNLYILCLSGGLFVCLYPINVKTVEPIKLKIVETTHVTPGKVYGCSELQKFVAKSFDFLKF